MVLNSLVQFDILSSLVSIADAGRADTAVFYTNFAPFRSDRVEPIVERLLADAEMRSVIFPLADSLLAQALQAIARMAYEEGARYGRFWGFDTSNVEDWIRQHLPPEA